MYWHTTTYVHPLWHYWGLINTSLYTTTGLYCRVPQRFGSILLLTATLLSLSSLLLSHSHNYWSYCYNIITHSSLNMWGHSSPLPFCDIAQSGYDLCGRGCGGPELISENVTTVKQRIHKIVQLCLDQFIQTHRRPLLQPYLLSNLHWKVCLSTACV